MKTRNNLTAPNFIGGEALAAYQGTLLNQRLASVESSSGELAEKYYRNSLRIKIGRWSDNQGEDGTKIQILHGSGNGIYAKLYCDKPGFKVNNRDLILVINGVPYVRTTDNNGKSEKLTIKLDKGTYLMSAFSMGYDGVNSSFTQKIVEVL